MQISITAEEEAIPDVRRFHFQEIPSDEKMDEKSIAGPEDTFSILDNNEVVGLGIVVERSVGMLHRLGDHPRPRCRRACIAAPALFPICLLVVVLPALDGGKAVCGVLLPREAPVR